ncbi:glutamine amidotransferase class-I family protein [Mycobacterium xenopi 3993]|nr:glutamine amidotransferase class-I family protein [Mycobacterium xenopi 3993]
MTARIGVITFPGTLDDVDAARAVRAVGAEPVSLWHADADLRGVDAVVVPGGFSYGDYLRAGAIARFAPVMSEVIAAATRGLPILGICNGFQVLCEAGLLPGRSPATLAALHLPRRVATGGVDGDGVDLAVPAQRRLAGAAKVRRRPLRRPAAGARRTRR